MYTLKGEYIWIVYSKYVQQLVSCAALQLMHMNAVATTAHVLKSQIADAWMVKAALAQLSLTAHATATAAALKAVNPNNEKYGFQASKSRIIILTAWVHVKSPTFVGDFLASKIVDRCDKRRLNFFT